MKWIVLILLPLFSLPAMATDVFYTRLPQAYHGEPLLMILTDSHSKACKFGLMTGKLAVESDRKHNLSKYPICWRWEGDGMTVYYPHTGQWFYNQSFGLIDNDKAGAAYQKLIAQIREANIRRTQELERAMENHPTNRGQ